MHTITRNFLSGALASAALLTSACTTVGPDYSGAPAAADGAAGRGAFLRAGDAATSEAPSARWWESLGDPVLGRLIEDALAGSPSVAAANARIAQARAALAISRTAPIPKISASASSPYINVPGGLLNPDGESGGRDDIRAYNVGFDASWELDLFGGSRRRTEASLARAQEAEAGLADAQVTLSAEVARAYVGLRSRQEIAALLERQLAGDRALVDLAVQRQQAGTAPAQQAAQLRAQLAQTEADLASARAEITVVADQLAVLVGREPGALDDLVASPAPVPLPPASVAVGDPALLLRQRPDIRVAERRLAAASADIGVQEAARLPRITFLGLLGIGGQDIGDVVDPSRIIGLALPRLTWTLFDGGRGARQVEQSRGAFAEAEANYRQSVLAALRDAENALTRFGSQRIALGRVMEAERQAATVAGLQQQRVSAGTASRSESLTAERQRLQIASSAASARAELTSRFIAVEKALGLGWSAPPAPAGARK